MRLDYEFERQRNAVTCQTRGRSGLSRWLVAWMVPAIMLMTHGSVTQAAPDVQDEKTTATPLSASLGARPGQTLTTLPNGLVLALGGSAATVSASLFDPQTGQARVLAQGLTYARKHHSATVLPEGKVLILGGMDGRGRIVAQAEIFDPQTQRFSPVGDVGLVARAHHAALMLTSGQLLVVGGIDARGNPVDSAELWHPRSGEIQVAERGPLVELPRAVASLLADGSVLLRSEGAAPQADAVRYDPARGRAERLPAQEIAQWQPRPASSPLSISASVPPQDDRHFEPDGLVVVRFSAPVSATSVSASTLTLLGPTGAVAAKVVPSQDGMLAFVTPEQSLFPATQYHLIVQGVKTLAGRLGGIETVSFATRALEPDVTAKREASRDTSQTSAALAPPQTFRPAGSPGATEAASEDEIFVPGEQHHYGRWRTGRPLPAAIAKKINDLLSEKESLTYEHAFKHKKKRPWRHASLRKQIAGAAVEGQVLRLNDKPLSRVKVSLAGFQTQTDEQGYFRLAGVPEGRHELFVDGENAGGVNYSYGKFVIGVDVKSGEATEVAPVYLPKIRAQDWISVPSPATQDMVLSTPAVPGLEIHVPKGTVFRGRDGRIVTKIALAPLPLDRVPFAFPENAPVYVSVQPGGMVVQGLTPGKTRGIRVLYPNLTQEKPGARAEFWRYDPREKGWYIYGHGQAGADGRHIVPDAGIELYDAIGFMYTLGSGPPNPSTAPPPCGGCPCDKKLDPVSCGSGLFLHTVTDIELNDLNPLAVTRTYRPGDSVSRAFGFGASHSYNLYMYMTSETGALTLVLPDGSPVHFDRISGTTYDNGVFENSTRAGEFYKAQIVFYWPTTRYILTTRTGTKYEFTAYSGAGLISVTDRFGNVTSVTRNAGLVSRVTSNSGRYLDFTYDGSNRVTQIQDMTGRTVSYEYNAAGTLAKATFPDSTFEEYTYDAAGRMLTVKDRRGNIMVTNTYDAGGRVIQQGYPDGTLAQVAYTVDGNGKITRSDVTDARGYVERLDYNAQGLITSKTLAFGTALAQTSTYEYAAGTNRKTAEVDAYGRRTEYGYDAWGDLTAITRMAGTASAYTESWTYTTDFHQVATHTNPLGHQTVYIYDTLGRLTELKDPLNNVTRFEYDDAGQVTRITDPLNHATALAYDFTDLASVTDPLGRATGFFTDALGRVLQVTDPLGNATLTEYDSVSRVKKLTDAQGNITQMSYDNNGNLTSVTDARLGLHQFGYDTRNRRTTRTDPLNRSESFVYDGNGNLTRVTDRKGQVTGFTYDALNRRSQTGFGATVANPTTYTSTITHSYDAANRLTQAVDTVAGTISRSYDDRFDAVALETTPQGSVSYTYDAAGRRASMTVSGQGAITYTFDNASRLTQITQGANVVQIGYDAAGRRQTLTLPNGVVQTYTFDDANQLTGITYTKAAVTLGTLTYSYDAAGRRISQGGSYARTQLPAAVSGTSFNALNQLTAQNAATLTYDDNGNLLTDGVNTYTWDARNQLSAISGSVTASFQYDPFGRRQSKTVGGTQTGFVYDGLNFVQEKSGVSVTANLLTGLGIDEVFTRTQGATTHTMLSEGLGSTLALTDSTGAVTNDYTYGPYGMRTMTGPANGNTQTYTAREEDGTGLMYYRARYYHPGLARFISEDPIGLAGGINSYSYVQGNPISYRDPTGTVHEFEVLLTELAALSHEGGVWAAGAAAAGAVGYGVGTVINRAIEHYGYDDRGSIGSSIYDRLHPETRCKLVCEEDKACTPSNPRGGTRCRWQCGPAS